MLHLRNCEQLATAGCKCSGCVMQVNLAVPKAMLGLLREGDKQLPTRWTGLANARQP